MGINESTEVAAKIMKEYTSILSCSVNCCSRRTDAAGRSEQAYKLHCWIASQRWYCSSRRSDAVLERPKQRYGRTLQENKICSKRCKATIREIAQQVQAEIEQWSQVQELLLHVREEMEDLKKSRDFWQDRALHAAEKVATLQMHDWRRKSHRYQIKELQSRGARMRNEIKWVQSQRHAVEKARWLDNHSIHTGKLLSKNSVSSSKGISDNHLSNHSANSEKAAHPKDDENWNGKINSDTKYMEMVKPKISKTVEKSRQKSPIKKVSEHCEVHRNGQSWSQRLQQKDRVTEKLSERKTKKTIEGVHSKENLVLQTKDRNTQIRKLSQRKRNEHHGSVASGKPCTMILTARNYALKNDNKLL